ncbi:D-alanyl-D-alanine carboxypeptidase family protein [Tepidibacillus sp. LV47]|uniref:D-alanyl-D-alanine carboxypeptidase family protein n=1 Tax=Tepidibacillus sp. LV47 TaxID=3398228 RepID=UPI003AAFBA30
MWKKNIIIGVISFLLFSLLPTQLIHAEEINLAPNARSAILIDQDTGTVLFDKNSHDRLPPASITKIMTMLLIMEAIDTGKITFDDKVRVSEKAASMGGSQIFLEAGEEMTVRDLLKGIAIASGNDATVAMAEYIAGTEEEFVKMMNKKAEELGLKDTHFVNTNGLPEENHYTTAYDIAVMSRELLKHEKITEFTGIYQDYLRKDSHEPFWLVNTNRLVRFYQGVDGLKTGYTSEAKYCLAATAKKGTFRVIAVVMGEPDSKTRNKEVSELLDYAFNQYKNEVLYKKDQLVTDVEVSKGSISTIPLKAPYQIGLLLKKGEKTEDFEQILSIKEQIQAPIQKGDVLGKLQIVKAGKVINEIPLIAAEEVSKANIFQMFKKVLRKQFLID